jgi:hypothetical protein
VAVARGDRLVAVFPAARAVWRGAANATEMEALLGVGVSPAELMDLLTGTAPPGARRYDASWGREAPKTVSVTFADGSRLTASVDSPVLGGPLPGAAFEPPASEGFRSVDAAEARRLLGIR